MAITIPTGPVSIVKTLASPPPAPIAPFSFVTTPITFDIPVDSLPKMISAGPIAATRAATFIIVSFWLSDRFLNHCVNSFTFSTTFVIVGCKEDKIVVPRSAVASFKLFAAIFASSHGSCVALNVSSTTFPYSAIDADKLSKSRRPSRIAVAISAAPLVPKISCAMLNASVSVSAFFMLSMVRARASSMLLPSSVYAFMDFLSPAMAVSAFTPLASNCAKRSVACTILRPISLKTGPFFCKLSMSVSTLIPVACPFWVSSPRTLAVSEASILYCSMILSTLPIELLRSVSFILANSINCFESSSNLSPVSPNRVLISPTAVPASSISIGKLVKRLFATSFNSSRASPVAPVFVMIVS